MPIGDLNLQLLSQRWERQFKVRYSGKNKGAQCPKHFCNILLVGLEISTLPCSLMVLQPLSQSLGPLDAPKTEVAPLDCHQESPWTQWESVPHFTLSACEL